METEIWKPIVGYEGWYEVSSLGNFRSLDRIDYSGKNRKGKVLKLMFTATGYRRFSLCKGQNQITVLAHRIVAQTFLDNPNNLPEVNHKNGEKDDNSIVNLEWVSHDSNCKHAWATGLMKHKWVGEKNFTSKFNEEDILCIREMREKTGLSCAKLAKLFDSSSSNIYGIITRQTWTHI